jgi:hypothetical protein
VRSSEYSGERGEEEGVGETAMAEHVAVRDAEREGNDIGVRQHRAEGGPGPKARR